MRLSPRSWMPDLGYFELPHSCLRDNAAWKIAAGKGDYFRKSLNFPNFKTPGALYAATLV